MGGGDAQDRDGGKQDWRSLSSPAERMAVDHATKTDLDNLLTGKPANMAEVGYVNESDVFNKIGKDTYDKLPKMPQSVFHDPAGRSGKHPNSLLADFKQTLPPVFRVVGPSHSFDLLVATYGYNYPRYIGRVRR